MTDRIKIEELVQQELTEANKLHPLFHSPHEAYGVLLEEVKEHEDEKKRIDHQMNNLFDIIMSDGNCIDVLVLIEHYAMAAAAEAIQVAAVCKKAIYGEENDWKTEN